MPADPTSSAAAIAAAAGHPIPKPAPTSTAERIAAMHPPTAEQPPAHPFMSFRDIRKEQLRQALRRQGHDRYSEVIERQLNVAPETGDPDEWAAGIAEQWPGLFIPTPEPTASELVRRFQSGATPMKPGS